jgi:hypothetical protein
MAESQEAAPEQAQQDVEREDVRSKVMEEFEKKFTKEDGEFDVKAAAKAFFHKDEKLHFANRESKDRRLKLAEKDKELEAREQRIKEAEEKKMLENQNYQELISKKNEELAGLKGQLDETSSKLEELYAYKTNIMEQNKTAVEAKYATLGKEAQEIFATAKEGFPEDYGRQMTLIEKLSVSKPAAPREPEGVTGKDHGQVDTDELMKLKETNPTLYYQKLRERAGNK